MNMKKPPQFLLLCLLTVAGSESGEAKTGITPLEKLYGRIGLTWNAQGKTDRVNGKVEEHWEYSGRVNAGVTLNGGFDGLWSNEAYATGTGSVSYDETCTYTTVDNSAICRDIRTRRRSSCPSASPIPRSPIFGKKITVHPTKPTMPTTRRIRKATHVPATA